MKTVREKLLLSLRQTEQIFLGMTAWRPVFRSMAPLSLGFSNRPCVGIAGQIGIQLLNGGAASFGICALRKASRTTSNPEPCCLV